MALFYSLACNKSWILFNNRQENTTQSTCLHYQYNSLKQEYNSKFVFKKIILQILNYSIVLCQKQFILEEVALDWVF